MKTLKKSTRTFSLLLLLGLCQFYPLHLPAQNTNLQWYFGNNAGIDWTSGSPVATSNGQTNNCEGTSTICDAQGNLLFYTEGAQVWDRNHNLMPNGTGLLGGFTFAQAALIMPLPGSCTLYYIFTTSDHLSSAKPMTYSVVDMNLNGGLGDVVVGQKNVLISNNVGEKLCAVRKSDNFNYWIVTHKVNSSEFLSFSFTSAGLNLTPVISNTGLFYSSNCGEGGIVANHAGTKIAVCAAFFCPQAQLADFNNTTGVISNPVTISGFANLPHGFVFSPDDSILYLNTFWGNCAIYQYQVTNLSSPYIVHSLNGNYSLLGIILGPNNKIYSGATGGTSLGVINNPNVFGPGCGFTANGFALAPGTSFHQGFPVFPEVYTNYFTYELTADTSGCKGDSIVLDAGPGYTSYNWSNGQTTQTIMVMANGTYSVTVTSACGTASDAVNVTFYEDPIANFSFSASGATTTFTNLTNASAGPTSYQWDFGDGNTSTAVNPTHTYGTNGSFIVVLMAYNFCDTTWDTNKILIDTSLAYSDLRNLHLELFPNPTHNQVMISGNPDFSGDATIDLLSIQGQMIREEKIQISGGKLAHLMNPGDLPSGIYLVRLRHESGQWVKRLVVE